MFSEINVTPKSHNTWHPYRHQTQNAEPTKNTENTEDEKLDFRKNGYKMQIYINLFE